MKVVMLVEAELNEERPEQSDVTVEIIKPDTTPEGWTPKSLVAAVAVITLYNSQPQMLDMDALAKGLVNEGTL